MFHDALFHLHTVATDGQLEVEDFFVFAKDRGVKRLIFLEHVRRNPTYDVAEFAGSVRSCSLKFGIEGCVGFEAKILPDGSLDIGAAALQQADFVGAAEHGASPEEEDVFCTYRRMFEIARQSVGSRPLVWVHPGLWLKRAGLLQRKELEYREHLSLASQSGLWVEKNLRYNLLPSDLDVKLENRCTGADAHTMADLQRWINWRDEQRKREVI